jgi:hypothetical protein
MSRTFGKDARKLNPGGTLFIIKQKKKLPGMFSKGGKEQPSFLWMERAESVCAADDDDDDDAGGGGPDGWKSEWKELAE